MLESDMYIYTHTQRQIILEKFLFVFFFFFLSLEYGYIMLSDISPFTGQIVDSNWNNNKREISFLSTHFIEFTYIVFSTRGFLSKFGHTCTLQVKHTDGIMCFLLLSPLCLEASAIV